MWKTCNYVAKYLSVANMLVPVKVEEGRGVLPWSIVTADAGQSFTIFFAGLSYADHDWYHIVKCTAKIKCRSLMSKN